MTATVVPPQLPGSTLVGPLLLLVRACAAAVVSAAAGVGGPLGLGLLSFALLPTCTTGDSPPALVAAVLGALLTAAVAPVAVAGRRLWWVGVPAAALAVHGLLPVAWPLLTEPQTGFCF